MTETSHSCLDSQRVPCSSQISTLPVLLLVMCFEGVTHCLCEILSAVHLLISQQMWRQ